MGRTFVSADAGRSLLPLYGPAQQAPWQGLLAMSWALTGMWQKGQVPFRAPRREAGPASVSVRVASQRAAHRPRHAARVCRSAAAFLLLRRVDEFDFSYRSTLELTTIDSPRASDFVIERRSVMFEGRPRRGTMHVAVVRRARQNGFDGSASDAPSGMHRSRTQVLTRPPRLWGQSALRLIERADKAGRCTDGGFFSRHK